MTSIDELTGRVSNDRAVTGDTGTSDTVPTPTASTDPQQQEQKEVEKRKKIITEEYMEGVLSTIPNSDYTAKTALNIKGIGKIFEGTYYFKKVTHTIGGDGYTVECEVLRMEEDNTTVTTSTEGRPKPEPTPAPKAPEAPKYKYITIKWGDTLWALSRKYGTTVSHLASINGIKNPNLIYAGAKLKVPS